MYGSTPAESIPIPKTERTKDVYYKNGKEISERHLIEDIMNNDYDEKKEIKYMVNERDMSNHWKATAANAIKPLQNMIVMATDNLMKKSIVWSGGLKKRRAQCSSFLIVVQ